MGATLRQISIERFKSIRRLERFSLGRLNVLVGANGVGKSNFVEFFRLLRAMAEKQLANFVRDNGNADTFFFGGPKESPTLAAELHFGENAYRFALAPTPDGAMTVQSEATYWRGSSFHGSGGFWEEQGGGNPESKLPEWKGHRSGFDKDKLSVRGHVEGAISGWVVYHFHDTSLLAPMRRPQAQQDWRELRPNAGNIAPFLLRLREESPAEYRRIREAVQLIAPFFDDFLLEPQRSGEAELVRLEWRQKGSSFPFQPWQLSDGTIRFVCLATALLQPSLPSTLVIDEPELGLHPFALELLAGLVNEASQRSQVILSTQSPAFLDTFRPEDIIVVSRLDDASQFQRLDAPALAEWLEDYSLGDLVQKNVIEAGPVYA